MNQEEIQEFKNPFTSQKVLNKYEKQVFNFAVKKLMQDSEPKITQSDGFKKVSEQWFNEGYRKKITLEFLSTKAEKLSDILEQLDLCIDALKA